jgi:hypothetical protein
LAGDYCEQDKSNGGSPPPAPPAGSSTLRTIKRSTAMITTPLRISAQQVAYLLPGHLLSKQTFHCN